MSALLYLGVMLLLTMGAAGVSSSVCRRPFSLSVPAAKRALWAGVLTVGVVYSLSGLFKWHAMQYGLWDFGIYDSLLHNAVSGQGMMRDFRGAFDHFSPLVLILVPFYAIWDSPVWLVLFQSWALALPALILFALARKYFRGNALFPLLLAVGYLLNPYFSRMALFDFHIECLFPLFYFSAFYCYAGRRYGWMTALLLASPLIKEDFVIPVVATGLFLFLRRRTWKYALAAILGGIFWTLFTLKIYFPYFMGMEYWHYGRYELFAPTLAGTLANLGTLAGRLWTAHAAAVLVSVLLPFGFLPLGNWKTLVFLLLPTVGIQLVSASPHQALLMSHYSSAVIAVVPLAALWGARNLRWRTRRHPAFLHGTLIFFVLLLGISHLAFADRMLSRYYSYIESNYHPAEQFGFLSLPFSPGQWQRMGDVWQHAKLFRLAAARLERAPGKVFAVQNEVGCEFLRQGRVFSLDKVDCLADYFVFDAGNFYRFDSPELLNGYLMHLRNPSGGFRLLYPDLVSQGILFFQRIPAPGSEK